MDGHLSVSLVTNEAVISPFEVFAKNYTETLKG